MATLVQDQAAVGDRNISALERNPQSFRRRAAQCRELAATCLTSDAQQVLVELASDLDREAFKLEDVGSRPIIGGGRR